MTPYELAKGLSPPLLVAAVRRLLGSQLRFDEVSCDWASAERLSDGYSQDKILHRVVSATRSVIAGDAAFERDSVTFREPVVPFQVASTILRSAAQDDGCVEVIDFGGSLGSTYHQSRDFLKKLKDLNWNIVEQASFVEAGNKEFSTQELHFYQTIAEVPPSSTPFTFIFSSVLQYLEEPYRELDRLHLLKSRHLLIDRTPFSELLDDQLSIQHTPRSVYKATYPCWILSRQKLINSLAPYWQLIADYQSPEALRRTSSGRPFEFRGLLFERRP